MRLLNVKWCWGAKGFCRIARASITSAFNAVWPFQRLALEHPRAVWERNYSRDQLLPPTIRPAFAADNLKGASTAAMSEQRVAPLLLRHPRHKRG